MNLKKYWFRLNVIIAFPMLLLVDIMIWITLGEDFIDLRSETLTHMKKAWYKY